MLRKRVIFTLLYENDQFMLSRNFRLQKVGDANWLQRNYNFADVAFYIDELVILDVSRGVRDLNAFTRALSQITAGCFAPIAAGGGITSVACARSLLRAGADKVVLNSALVEDPRLVREIAAEFGQQCVIGSVDLKLDEVGTYHVYTRNGSCKLDRPAIEALGWLAEGSVGELYINSIDRDGTGLGYDLGTVDLLPPEWKLPVIIAGGVGNAKHFVEGLAHPRVDAVATAHLFNFVGNGLKKARHALLESGYKLAYWPEIGGLDPSRAMEKDG
jgi:cyclase